MNIKEEMDNKNVKGFNAIVSVPTRKNGEKWVKHKITSCEPNILYMNKKGSLRFGFIQEPKQIRY